MDDASTANSTVENQSPQLPLSPLVAHTLKRPAEQIANVDLQSDLALQNSSSEEYDSDQHHIDGREVSALLREADLPLGQAITEQGVRGRGWWTFLVYFAIILSLAAGGFWAINGASEPMGDTVGMDATHHEPSFDETLSVQDDDIEAIHVEVTPAMDQQALNHVFDRLDRLENMMERLMRLQTPERNLVSYRLGTRVWMQYTSVVDTSSWLSWLLASDFARVESLLFPPSPPTKLVYYVLVIVTPFRCIAMPHDGKVTLILSQSASLTRLMMQFSDMSNLSVYGWKHPSLIEDESAATLLISQECACCAC
jgi:hypothetical protein